MLVLYMVNSGLELKEHTTTHNNTQQHTTTHTPTNMLAAKSPLDFDVTRQKRLSKFLLNCAKAGVQPPLPLDATQQDNATFDTMLEVAVECEAIGIPTADRPHATTSAVALATPETGARNCFWDCIYNEETRTPALPEDDETLDDYNYPNFNGVFASFLTFHKDGYGEDYDPTKDPYCVAYEG